MCRRLLAGAILLAAVAGGCDEEPALVRQLHKERLISAIQQALLQSAEAEKSAVLAITDEESKAMAREAEASAAEINQLRGELRPLIVDDGRQEEIEKLDAFDRAWGELETIDKRLLTLAVANTNLKAAQLSGREGAAALDRLVDTLGELQGGVNEPETIRALSHASIAALRVQSLLLVHIPTAEDAEMTRLEQRMRGLSEDVDRNLASARERGQVSAEQLAPAVQAWAEYQRLAADVLRLSRQNTNIISFDVSIHEKRRQTKECVAKLTDLLNAIRSGPHGTR